MYLIELNVDLPTNTLHGVEPINACYCLYLGKAAIDGNLTDAIRNFNLPTAIAPGEWPHGHDRTALQMLFQSFAPLQCNCGIPNQIQCDMHGPCE